MTKLNNIKINGVNKSISDDDAVHKDYDNNVVIEGDVISNNGEISLNDIYNRINELENSYKKNRISVKLIGHDFSKDIEILGNSIDTSSSGENESYTLFYSDLCSDPDDPNCYYPEMIGTFDSEPPKKSDTYYNDENTITELFY